MDDALLVLMVSIDGTSRFASIHWPLLSVLSFRRSTKFETEQSPAAYNY
jgi:hypothetical protein